MPEVALHRFAKATGPGLGVSFALAGAFVFQGAAQPPQRHGTTKGVARPVGVHQGVGRVGDPHRRR
jgi:hypothetical protein